MKYPKGIDGTDMNQSIMIDGIGGEEMQLTVTEGWVEVKNYINLKSYSPIFTEYAYADVPEYYADRILAKRKVFIRFGEEMAHPNYCYRIVFVKCPRWQKKKFELSMDELKRVMAYNGHSDYEDFCHKIIEEVQNKLSK